MAEVKINGFNSGSVKIDGHGSAIREEKMRVLFQRNGFRVK